MNKKNILLGFLVLLTAAVIIGGAQYNKSVQAEKMTKSEQKIDRTETIKQLVNSLFKNEKKQELADDVTEKEIKDVLKQVKELPTSLANEKLLKDVNTASLFYKTQEKVGSLLTDTILSDNIIESQLEEAKDSLKKIEPLSLTLFKELSEKLAEATVQFEYNESTIKVLNTFFEDTDKKVVKDDVTRERFEQVQKKISAIKNQKIKKEQKERLKLVEEKLIKKEEEKLLEEEKIREEEKIEEEEKLKEEAEKNQQNNLEENKIESNTDTTYEESINTWEPESSQPTKPWKPAKPWKPTKPWKPSDNNNPTTDVKPETKPETKPEVKPVPIPKPDENPDKEPEPPKEPEPLPDSSTGSDSF